MNLKDFDYSLPNELIARYPLEQRRASRLLCLHGDLLVHRKFEDIIHLIAPNDLLVCNNSRVIPARLLGQKESGGKVEVFVERILDNNRILALVRASKSPKMGSFLYISNKKIRFSLLSRRDDLFELYCHESRPVSTVIEEIGHVPLPPYLQRADEIADKERYQTVYAQHKGSVAAPTAGLHFDKELMESLIKKQVTIGFVTLHVGLGTFAPVRVDQISEHKMHSEYMEVSEGLCEQIKKCKQQGGKIIAVGTTSARALETVAALGEMRPYQGETKIFISPGYQFKCVDALITNLHLPESTLLMLVATLGGYDQVMKAYHEAVKEKYRFFSYGDAMWVDAARGTR